MNCASANHLSPAVEDDHATVGAADPRLPPEALEHGRRTRQPTGPEAPALMVESDHATAGQGRDDLLLAATSQIRAVRVGQIQVGDVLRRDRLTRAELGTVQGRAIAPPTP